jgi:hypothetical protein
MGFALGYSLAERSIENIVVKIVRRDTEKFVNEYLYGKRKDD